MHIAVIRAPEAIDGLIFVTDHKHIILRFGEFPHQKILRGVGVLKLIDQQIFRITLVVFHQIGIFAEQHGGIHQQIIKVTGVAGDEDFLITSVDARDDFFGVIRTAIMGGINQFILCAGDVVEHLARPEFLRVDIQFGDGLPDHRQLIVSVVDEIIGFAVCILGFTTQ